MWVIENELSTCGKGWEVAGAIGERDIFDRCDLVGPRTRWCTDMLGSESL
jgi:hypothetical protein